MGRLTPRYDMPTADVGGAFRNLMEANKATSAAMEGFGTKFSGVIDDLDKRAYTKQVSDVLASGDPRKMMSVDFARLTPEAATGVQQRMAMAEQGFKLDERDRALSERMAMDEYRKKLAEGPSTASGILTSTMAPSEVDAMAYSPEEMKATQGVNFTDTADLRRKLLEAGTDAKLVDSTVRKTERQLGLSKLADSLPGRREVQETNLQRLERVANEMSSRGVLPPTDLLDRIESARTAEMAVQQKKQEDAAAEVAKVREELAKAPMAYAKLVDEANESLYGRSGNRRSSNKFDEVESYQEAADKLNKYADGLYGGTKGNPKVKQAQVNAAQTMLHQLVTSQGLHPSLARGVVEQSFRKDPGKSGSWYFLGLDKKDKINDIDIARFNEALGRAKELQQGLMISSGGFGSGQGGVDNTAAQRQALMAQASGLDQRLAGAQARQELADMTPEQRQQAQMRSILNESGVVPREIVKAQAPEPRGKRSLGGGLNSTPRTEVRWSTPVKAQEVSTRIAPPAPTLPPLPVERVAPRKYDPRLIGVQDSIREALKGREAVVAPNSEDTELGSKAEIDKLISDVQGKRTGLLNYPSSAEVKEARSKLREIYLMNPARFQQLYGPSIVKAIYR